MTLGTPQDPQGGVGNASLPSAVSEPAPTDNIQTPPAGSVDPAAASDSGTGATPTGTPAGAGQESVQTNLTVEDIVNGGWKQLIPAELKDRSEFPLLSENYYDEGSVIMNKDNDDLFQWRD